LTARLALAPKVFGHPRKSNYSVITTNDLTSIYPVALPCLCLGHGFT